MTKFRRKEYVPWVSGGYTTVMTLVRLLMGERPTPARMVRAIPVFMMKMPAR